jgi:hypothetical protein
VSTAPGANFKEGLQLGGVGLQDVGHQLGDDGHGQLEILHLYGRLLHVAHRIEEVLESTTNPCLGPIL